MAAGAPPFPIEETTTAASHASYLSGGRPGKCGRLCDRRYGTSGWRPVIGQCSSANGKARAWIDLVERRAGPARLTPGR